MSTTEPLWAVHELERVMGPERVATWNARTRQPGGEWDVIRSLPPRTRRRLTGAGFFSAGGLMPDVAADLIVSGVGGVDTVDDALRWYVRTATEAIRQARRGAEANRRAKQAARLGVGSFYEVRVAQARAAGHRSLWAYRQARGWGENRRPKWRPGLTTRPRSG